MSGDGWIVSLVAIVVVPSVAWLVKEVISLRRDLVKLAARVKARELECNRHQRWEDELDKTLGKMARNITRLCTTLNVKESE